MNRLRFLLLAFIIVPALEIWLFILAGRIFGGLLTVALIIGTGILGAYLAKLQGVGVIRSIQEQIQMGRPPGAAMLEGACVLMGALMLLTPGFITDFIGLFFLLPPTRKMMQTLLLKIVRQWTLRSQIYIYR